MNYYERHLGDYAKDAAHLSMMEHGAYCLLLDRYYSTEKGIENEKIYKISRAHSKEEKKSVDNVLKEFFLLIDGVWINKRAEEEISKALVKIRAAKENGKKGGRPKVEPKAIPKQTKQEPTGLLLGFENETQKKAHQTPDTIKEEPPIPPKGGNPSKRENTVTLKTFMADCKAKGEMVIPDDDPIYRFADELKIPDDWLVLAWREFIERYKDSPKRYSNWRKVFRNAVRGNWFKVWYCNDNGEMCLTSQGRILQQAHQAVAA